MTKAKKIILLLICFLTLVFSLLTAVVSFAYFSKKEIYDGYFSGEVELLFDRLNAEGMTAYQTHLNEVYKGTEKKVEVKKDAVWGTEAYPYVISDVRHLYNLSELQRLGFFDKKFISNTETPFSIPYFLVCTPEYTPVLIDGTNFKGITSIGTDEFPFIGSVCGVKSKTQKIEVGEKWCDTSTISNIKVSGNPANADVGLFGYVGYLGEEPGKTEETVQTFTGQISTLSNLVLTDVQVTVKSSLWDKVTAFLEDIAINATEGHRYSFTELHNNTNDYNKVPHENHHVGILAGHADYAKIEYISVYYSADNIVAIDLKDETKLDDKNKTEANYLSATGILGYIYNINPTFTNNQDGSLTITPGSGDSVGDLSYGTVGGGGLLSGMKSGYVLAAEMWKSYHYVMGVTEGGEEKPVPDDDGTIYLKDAVDKDGNALCEEWIRDRLLWGTEATGRYYFYDGVFTFALSSQQDVIEPTWNNDDGKADEFSIGQNSEGAWQTNYSKGNNAVVAYVEKITDNGKLNDAISAGKQIFIMKENEENIFLMSLYKQSTTGSGDFETKYSTPGVTQEFGSDDFVRSLIESYEGGDLALPADMSGYTKEKLIDALKNGTLRAINVGITSSTVSLEQLQEQYKISASTTEYYSYYDEKDTPVSVNSDGTVNQYYDYSQSDYSGYIYFTYEKKVEIFLTRTYYTYYWQTQDGSKEIGGSSYFLGTAVNTPSDVFVDTGNVWGGTTSDKQEKIYSYTYNGTTYTGVVVNKTDGVFYGTGHTANANGPDLTISSDGTLNYFYKDTSGKIFHSLDSQTEITETLNDTGNKSLSGQTIYSIIGGEQTGVLLSQYPTYLFSSGNNYLRMIKAIFSSYGNKYAIWNGTDTDAEDRTKFTHQFAWYEGAISPSSVSNSTRATLRFNSDGTCYIQYSIDSVGLYVNSTGSVFNTATSNTFDSTKLSIYVVEGTQDINYGRITFDPIDDPTSETDCYTFSADETVLLATHPTGVDENNNNTIGTTTTTYEAVKLSDLGWNNGSGETVSSADLQKKFKMLKGITFGASFNLFNGNINISGGEDQAAIITAPVGSNGTEANIPQSCIAFRINKEAKDIKIRVIVSVAVSEYYPGEKGQNGELYTLGAYTRYFNLWKMEAAGESIVQVFDATGDDLLDRFEVPRSHPYKPGTKETDAEYITVNYNGGNYRCYLNGDRVLVAYEFNVNSTADGTGTGVYCLGMSGIDSSGKAVSNVPMEIVYFSAEGVASAGRDGASGSQIGTIDFVYDYKGDKDDKGAIVTVTDYSEMDSNGNEDYHNYYPSYCLLYFDIAQKKDSSTEAYYSVNDEVVIIRRYVYAGTGTPGSDANHNTTPSKTILFLKSNGIHSGGEEGGIHYTCIVQYSTFADNVNVGTKEQE